MRIYADLPQDLADKLDKYVDDQKIKIQRNKAIIVAVEYFLMSEGY